MGDSGVGSMKQDAIAVVVLSAVVLTGIAVVNGFKQTTLVDNATADSFITGLQTFATFIGVIVIILVARIIIRILRVNKDD